MLSPAPISSSVAILPVKRARVRGDIECRGASECRSTSISVYDCMQYTNYRMWMYTEFFFFFSFLFVCTVLSIVRVCTAYANFSGLLSHVLCERGRPGGEEHSPTSTSVAHAVFFFRREQIIVSLARHCQLRFKSL